MEDKIIVDNYRINIHDQGDSKIDIMAIYELTEETFTVKSHTLVKIKPITIEAALKK